MGSTSRETIPTGGSWYPILDNPFGDEEPNEPCEQAKRVFAEMENLTMTLDVEVDPTFVAMAHALADALDTLAKAGDE